MSEKRPGRKGKARKAREKTTARAEQLMRKRNVAAVRKLKLSDIAFGVSAFVGQLVHRETQEQLKCEVCQDAVATWAHELKKGGKAYLCFGCGDH